MNGTSPESSLTAQMYVQNADQWETVLGFIFQKPAWMADAACRGKTHLMYDGKRGQARYICEPCPVREQCRDWAVNHNETEGMWGGLSERNRRKLRKERGLARAKPNPAHGQIAMWRTGCRCVKCEEAHQREVRRGRLKDLGGAA